MKRAGQVSSSRRIVAVLALTTIVLAGRLFSAPCTRTVKQPDRQKTPSVERDLTLGLPSSITQRAASLPQSSARIHPHLSWQRLSHHALHKTLYQHLVNTILPAPRGAEAPRKPAVIVGVEYGKDVLALARMGFPVIGFEPMKQFREHVERAIAREAHLAHAVKLMPYAAVENATSTPQISIRYQKQPVYSAPTITLDQALQSIGVPSLSLLSVDIQGAEPGVLRGARQMLKGGSIDAVLVEVSMTSRFTTCRLTGQALIEANYVIFDFCWWSHKAGLDEHLCIEDGDEARMALDAYCARVEAMFQQRQFVWLQTDFVAIRREAVTDSVLHGLATLSKECNSNCRLRQLIFGEGG